MATAAEKPCSILEAALLMAADGCPPEAGMMLCRLETDDTDDACSRCWWNYLLYVANNRTRDPYAGHR